MALPWRFVNTGPGTGEFNMRLDEALAEALARRDPDARPTLRLFQWKPWAISLGYHQQLQDIDAERAARDGIDIVRRPTGGRAILHAEELTYSVVMEAGRKSILQVYNDISRALVRGLAFYGVNATLQKSQPNFREEYSHASSVPCFSSSARYEIEWNGRKLVGSAQRRYASGEQDVVLQHGSLLCGPAHRRLSHYLAIQDLATVSTIDRTLAERTADLAEITGEPVDLTRLAECLWKGFERAWGVTIAENDGSHLLSRTAEGE